MGEVRGRGSYTYVCAVFRRRSRLYSMDDHGRIVQPRTEAGGHVDCRSRQLAFKFPRRSFLPSAKGDILVFN